MRPLSKDRLSTVFLACLILVFCSVFSAHADDCKRVQNILILFDASGFMREKNHYEMLLRQMRLFAGAMPVTADGFFNVGIRHYGLKVGMECRSTESILAVQPWDPQRFINSFPKTISYGVSALSAGLRGAADDLAAAEGKSIIILIGGGLESCKSDPIKIADQVAFNNPDLEIHTFQIGSEQEGKFFLSGIAQKGRGTFVRVNEINSPAGWFSWMKRFLVMPCRQPQAAVPQVQAAPVEVGAILFDYNSFSVHSKDSMREKSNMANLHAVAKYLLADPQARVVLHGYTDGKGSPKFNLKLSRRRAEAVQRFLVSAGVPANRIAVVAHGMGQGPPGARTPAQGVPGRRVEFEIFK